MKKVNHNLLTVTPTMVAIETLSNHDFFMLKAGNKINDKTVFSFDGYCRYNKKYMGNRCSGEGERYLKKGTLVLVGFEY